MKYMPTWYCNSIFTIDTDILKKNGIRYIFTDLDNTLVPYNIHTPTNDVITLVDHLKNENFKVIIVSNNTAKRVETFAKNLNVKLISGAKKPFTYVIGKYIKDHNINLNECVLIGDQLMTDIKCALKLKCKCVLTSPLSKQEALVTYINRRIDLYYRKKYNLANTCKNIDRSDIK